MLTKLDAPHSAIHALGAQVEALKQAGQYEQAGNSMERESGKVLARLLALFAELRQQIQSSERELAVVLVGRNGPFAVTIDAALSVEKFGADGIEVLPCSVSVQSGMARRIAKMADGRPVLILEVDELLDCAKPCAAA
jgi:hypothetical protein